MGATARQPRVPLTPVPPIAPESAPAAAAAPLSTRNLDAAVLRVMAAAPTLIRNARGQVGSRNYGYVTNDAVVDAVLPLLVQEELLWKAWPTVCDGQPALRYRMTHIPSGEFDEDTMLLLCDRTSQGQGSGITYSRRYSLVTYLNLTVDPDDDGAAAMGGPVRTINEPQQPAAPAAAPAQSQSGTRPASVKQRSMLKAKARDAGLTSSQFADCLLAATGNEPRRMDEAAAERWLSMGLDRFPGKKATMDAAIALIEGGRS